MAEFRIFIFSAFIWKEMDSLEKMSQNYIFRIGYAPGGSYYFNGSGFVRDSTERRMASHISSVREG